MIVFFFWPAFDSLRLSVFTVTPFGDREIFVGLDNFVELLTDPAYGRSVLNSFIFSLGVTTLGLAVRALSREPRQPEAPGPHLLPDGGPLDLRDRAPRLGDHLALHLPPDYGMLPYLLSMVTTYEFNWLLKGWIAMLLVICAAAWAHLGYNIAFFLAGLQTIPRSVMDAARVDGASGVGLFRWITFPLLSPVTFFLFIMNMVFSFFETFGIIHAVTQGGPGDTTTIMVYKTYVDGFVHLRMGYSAAQSVILMALVIALTVLQFRYTERKVYY